MAFKGLIYIAGLLGFGALGTALASDVTFSVTGSFNDGASLGGTFVVDTATGIVESNGLDLIVTGGEAGTPGFVFDTLDGSGVFFDGTNDLAYIDGSDSADVFPDIQLEFNLGTAKDLTNFTGAPLCYVPADFPVAFPEGDNCASDYSHYELESEGQNPGDPQLLGGSASQSSAPEPASLLLLAGPAALLVRRQLRKS